MQQTNNSTHNPIEKDSKVVVFGATGLVGSSIVRKLLEKGYTNIVATYHNKKPNSTLSTQPSTLYYLD